MHTCTHQVYRSIIIQDNLNPTFPTFTMPLKDLVGDDTKTRIIIEVKDFDFGQKNDHMGYILTNVYELESNFR